MNSRKVLLVLTIAVAMFVTYPASGEIVYDGLTGIPSNGGLGCCSGFGASIAIAGSGRHVTEFELWLGASGNSTFIVEFYNLDGLNGSPGSLIWQSPVQAYPYTPGPYNYKVLAVDVPNIQVPGEFLWALTTIERANNTLVRTGPPTIGTRLINWQYDTTLGGWRRFIPDWDFGVRITAVPEPSALGLALFLAGLAAIRRSR